MGLDMYIYAGKYLSDYTEPEQMAKVLDIIGGKEIAESCGNFKSVEVKVQAGYWRKANAIHKWFVDNVQDGEDDCGNYSVSRESLQELRDTVKKVLSSSPLVAGKIHNGTRYTKAKSGKMKEEAIIEDGQVMADSSVAEALLPCQSGFFFGGTEYNEWYYRDLESTVEIINRLLALPDEWDFYYHSSW